MRRFTDSSKTLLGIDVSAKFKLIVWMLYLLNGASIPCSEAHLFIRLEDKSITISSIEENAVRDWVTAVINERFPLISFY